jgi:hypothetical protein
MFDYIRHNSADKVLKVLIGTCPPERALEIFSIPCAKFKHSPLMLAAAHGTHACIKMLMDVCKIDVARRDVLGMLPLHWSVRNSFVEASKELLDATVSLMSNKSEADAKAISRPFVDANTLLYLEDGAGLTPYDTASKYLRFSVYESSFSPRQKKIESPFDDVNKRIEQAKQKAQTANKNHSSTHAKSREDEIEVYDMVSDLVKKYAPSKEVISTHAGSDPTSNAEAGDRGALPRVLVPGDVVIDELKFAIDQENPKTSKVNEYDNDDE